MSSQQGSPPPFRWHYSEFEDSSFKVHGHTLFFFAVLFTIILLLTILFLHARWVCRLHIPSPPPSISAAAAAADHPPPSGVDPIMINDLPIILFKSEQALGSGECCICLILFEDGHKVKVLPECKHCFHSDCVDEWLNTQSNCPLCRASIGIDLLV